MTDSAKPLPPLSHAVLQNILHVQNSATRGLKACGYGGTSTLDKDKATEILCSCAIEEAELRFNYYEHLPDFCVEWVKQIAIRSVESMLACFPQHEFIVPQKPRLLMPGFQAEIDYEEPSQFMGTVQRAVGPHVKRRWQAKTRLSAERSDQPSTIAPPPLSPQELLAAHRAKFPDAGIMDICWAARQRYHEWNKWIKGRLKADSKPDRMFRFVLTHDKNPKELRRTERPKGWR
jgi:hypothetical protein